MCVRYETKLITRASHSGTQTYRFFQYEQTRNLSLNSELHVKLITRIRVWVVQQATPTLNDACSVRFASSIRVAPAAKQIRD
jgi:hypothetical protein